MRRKWLSIIILELVVGRQQRLTAAGSVDWLGQIGSCRTNGPSAVTGTSFNTDHSCKGRHSISDGKAEWRRSVNYQDGL